MLVSKIALSFDHEVESAFTMKSGVLYSNDQVPSWVVKTQNFKDAKAKDLITGDYEEKAKLDIDLIKRANFLEINFDKNIEEKALETLVANAEDERKKLIEALEAKGEKVQPNSKTSTLKAKLESLGN